MTARGKLATQALNAASKMRRRANILRLDPLCVYDVAEKLNVEVKFIDAPSLEGMYRAGDRPTIVLPALHHRPPGRLAFSCAHELGHHAFGHGTKWDEYVEHEPRATFDNPEEWLADRFASFLLMPIRAVEKALRDREITLSSASAVDLYRVACQFGVGYSTLLGHLRWSLNLMSARDHERFSKSTPKSIRREILGDDTNRHLIIMDQQWNAAIAADLRVGDVALLPHGITVEGSAVSCRAAESGNWVEGLVPGCCRATIPGTNWAVFLRVARRNFWGRSMARHLEECDD